MNIYENTIDRSTKRLIAILRRRHGKKNGVIPRWAFDRAEFIWRTCKRKRRSAKREDAT